MEINNIKESGFVEELWKKAIEFHGHECPGLAIGFKAKTCKKKIFRM